MRKFCMVIATLLALCLGGSLSAYADGTDGVDAVASVGNDPIVGGIVKSINNQPEVKAEIIGYSGGTGLVTFSNQKYSKLKLDDRRIWMSYALKSVQQSNLNARVKNKLYNFIADQDGPISSSIRQLDSDVGADIASAGAVWRVFSNPLSIFFGVIVIAIFVFITFRLVSDIVFLTIPPMTLIGLRKAEQNNGKVWWVSKDAIEAQTEDDSKSGSSILFSWFVKSFKSIAVVSFVIILMVTGKIWYVIIWIVNTFTGSML